MKEVLLHTNLVGRHAHEPEFRPLLRQAADPGLPILLHPNPVTSDPVKDCEMISSLGEMRGNLPN